MRISIKCVGTHQEFMVLYVKTTNDSISLYLWVAVFQLYLLSHNRYISHVLLCLL